jgi:hypothetical protein
MRGMGVAGYRRRASPAAARLRLRLDWGRAAHPSWYLNPGLLLEMTMTNTEARGSKTTDSSDWNHAWSVVSQLAAARGTALHALGRDDRAAVPGAKIDTSDAAATPAPPFAPIAPDQLARDIAEIEQAATALRQTEPAPAEPAPAEPARESRVPDQLARDIAEIEQAAAVLRRAEPALEPTAPESPAGLEPRVARSIWPLVCVIWLTAAVVVSCAIAALVLLVG